MENIEEEVMKALEFKALHDAKIAYIDGAACKHIFVEQILEYVKKLQAENKRLRKTTLSAIEESRAYELDNENMQNAIERLTEVMNDFRQEVITLNNEKLKLQQQVDELTERYLEESKERCKFEHLYNKKCHEHNIGLGVQRKHWEKKVQQAVKDTAKEICDLILENWEKKQFVECDWLRVEIGLRYGVGVD